jgi:hypothetical protein
MFFNLLFRTISKVELLGVRMIYVHDKFQSLQWQLVFDKRLKGEFHTDNIFFTEAAYFWKTNHRT